MTTSIDTSGKERRVRRAAVGFRFERRRAAMNVSEFEVSVIWVEESGS
jgi:hypothetical protein